VQRIGQDYNGNAGEIWANQPSSAEVVYRFLQFDGIGRKIATMAANILAREFKVPFADYYSIDVSVDVQLRRVFARLGLARMDDDVDKITYLARALHPPFPGLLDLPAWMIGRDWCRPQNPACGQCMMREVCPTANVG
jgi:endonuclease III